jgi:hypothetical protein
MRVPVLHVAAMRRVCNVDAAHTAAYAVHRRAIQPRQRAGHLRKTVDIVSFGSVPDLETTNPDSRRYLSTHATDNVKSNAR